MAKLAATSKACKKIGQYNTEYQAMWAMKNTQGYRGDYTTQVFQDNKQPL